MAYLKRALIILCITGVVEIYAYGQEQKEPPKFNVRVNLVSVDVEVLDPKGTPITDLRQNDFRVKENGTVMEITNFSRLSDRPVSLVIVLDTSAIPLDKLLVAKRFILELIHLLGRQDEICLYTFDDRDAYLEQGFTADRRLLVDALENIGVPSGRKHTLLNDLFGATPQIGLGVDLGLAAAQKSSYGKKALLLISDRYKGLGPATVEHVEAAGCTLLTLSFANKASNILSLGGDAISKKQLTRESGGREFSGDKGDIDEICRSVAYSLKNHYQIGYLTKEPAPSEKRRIEVLVPERQCSIYARHSYIAPR